MDRPAAVIRDHKVPRKRVFAPSEDDDLPPIPRTSIDGSGSTKTRLEEVDEATTQDVPEWRGQRCPRFEHEWKGDHTCQVAQGSAVIRSRQRKRVTRLQQTHRPGDVWPEVWKMTNSNQKQEANEHYERYTEKMRIARERRGTQIE